MDVNFFNEVVFEKLKENKTGIILELSNGNQKLFTAEDVKGCSIWCSSVFCIETWVIDINSIEGICYDNPVTEAADKLKEVLGL